MPVSLLAAASLSLGAGALLLVYAATQALGATPPPTPQWLAFGIAGIAELALGIGLLRRRRLAWAFALSLDGTGLCILLIAAPRIARAGHTLPLALLPAAIALFLLLLLLFAADEFK